MLIFFYKNLNTCFIKKQS